MINRKILLSSVSILSALGMMAGSTFAFFTATANSTNNTFSSGTFGLNVRDNNDNFGTSITQSFTTPANWAPGDTSTGFVCFKNTGSIPIQQILFSLSTADTDQLLAGQIHVQSIELGPVASNTDCQNAGAFGENSLTDFTPLFNTRFGTNATLTSLLSQINGLDKTKDDLIDGVENKLDPNQILKMRVIWKFNDDATSAVAGKTLHIDLGFNATQNEESTP